MTRSSDFGHNHLGPHYTPDFCVLSYPGRDAYPSKRSKMLKGLFLAEVQKKKEVYKDYVNIRQRKAFKDAASAFKKGKVCKFCRSDLMLCVHHLKYHEDPLDFSDAVVLCKACHAWVHGRGPRPELRGFVVSSHGRWEPR